MNYCVNCKYYFDKDSTLLLDQVLCWYNRTSTSLCFRKTVFYYDKVSGQEHLKKTASCIEETKSWPRFIEKLFRIDKCGSEMIYFEEKDLTEEVIKIFEQE